jgi:hypothetical protein
MYLRAALEAAANQAPRAAAPRAAAPRAEQWHAGGQLGLLALRVGKIYLRQNGSFVKQRRFLGFIVSQAIL